MSAETLLLDKYTFNFSNNYKHPSCNFCILFVHCLLHTPFTLLASPFSSVSISIYIHTVTPLKKHTLTRTKRVERRRKTEKEERGNCGCFFFWVFDMDHVLHFVIGIFGNAFALFLFLSPLITFKRIVKNRSTEQFSGIPYVMTLLNCLLSAWYGMPFVSPNNLLVSTINGTGAAIELVYVMIFLLFAPKKEKAKIMGLFSLVLAVFATVVLVSLLALHGNGRKLFCGVAATVFSIIMYGSPLTIIRLVIKTKSVEFMPFFLSLFVFLCGTSWFIFGLLGKDPFVAIPNGFGCGLGTVQLILYAIYHNNKGESKKPGADEMVEIEKSNGKAHQEQV